MNWLKKSMKNSLFFVWKLFDFNQAADNLFLLGHARSGSSLLMHILTNNDEILGFGEYHTSYKTKEDLLKAAFDIRRKNNCYYTQKKYIANQINDQNRTPNLDLLIKEKIKIIILIRQPPKALSSMFLYAKKAGFPMEKEAVVRYYIHRLQYFFEIASQLPAENWTFVTYEDLLENTTATLQQLSEFLDLKNPLTQVYKKQKYTQISGDSSENILQGKIIKTTSEQVDFEDKLLDLATETYQKTLKEIERNLWKD